MRPPASDNRAAFGWQVYVGLVVFMVVVVAASFFTFSTVRGLVADAPLGASNPADPSFTGGQGADDPSDPASEVIEVREWREGRVTILLLGIDERESETGPFRTDTMILFTVDPESGRAAMLSIPRDLWVEIPGYGISDRVNTANFRGDADQYPGFGGPGLAMETVRYNLGIDVDYFVTINFQAFLGVIDELGCVPITVPETIDDPDYPALDGYGYDPFYLEAGEHCLDSETLLKYARTRATYGGDFDRAQRQQAVIYAVRDHVLSTGQLASIIARAPQLYNKVADGIETNLSLQQIVDLARLATEINEANICGAVINGPYVDPRILEDSSQILVPLRDNIRELILDIENGTGVCDPATGRLAEQATAEVPRIRVLNGTNQSGLATETAERIAFEGFEVVGFANADTLDYETSVITAYNGKEASAQYMAQLLGLPLTLVESGGDNAEYDVEIIIGYDYEVPG